MSFQQAAYSPKYSTAYWYPAQVQANSQQLSKYPCYQNVVYPQAKTQYSTVYPQMYYGLGNSAWANRRAAYQNQASTYGYPSVTVGGSTAATASTSSAKPVVAKQPATYAITPICYRPVALPTAPTHLSVPTKKKRRRRRRRRNRNKNSTDTSSIGESLPDMESDTNSDCPETTETAFAMLKAESYPYSQDGSVWEEEIDVEERKNTMTTVSMAERPIVMEEMEMTDAAQTLAEELAHVNEAKTFGRLQRPDSGFHDDSELESLGGRKERLNSEAVSEASSERSLQKYPAVFDDEEDEEEVWNEETKKAVAETLNKPRTEKSPLITGPAAGVQIFPDRLCCSIM